VRDGAFCAHPLLRELTAGEAPDGAVRASVGIGTRAADVDRLVEAIAYISRNGAAWSYRAGDGYFVPEPAPRPWPALGGLLADHPRLSLLPPCSAD